MEILMGIWFITILFVIFIGIQVYQRNKLKKMVEQYEEEIEKLQTLGGIL